MWRFDLNTNTWTELDDGSGVAPQPRYFATSAYVESASTYYVYGGGTNTSALVLEPVHELWSWNATDGWESVAMTGTAPSLRMFFAYAHDTTRNRLILFGGQLGDFVSAAFNDLYALDLTTFEWTRLHGGGGGADVPSGRFLAMMTYDADNDVYLVTGGHADGGVENDMWSFDPTTNAWTLLRKGDTFVPGASLGCNGNPREIPASYMYENKCAPERRQGGLFAMLDGKAWLIGGESDCSDHLDDTWYFDFDTTLWTEVQEATSGESCFRRNAACTCLCL